MIDATDELRHLTSAPLCPPETIDQLRGRIHRRRRRQLAAVTATVAAVVAVVLGSTFILRAQEDGASHVVTPGPEITIVEDTTAPSQSPEEAKRDMVIPALAELATDLRVDVRASVDTPEGRWVLSRATPELQQIGDTPGFSCHGSGGAAMWTVDEGCIFGYGEILLLDDNGRIVQAYPMPSIPPTWLTVTDRFIYAGRQGDGGYPDSSLVRIERATRRVETVTYRANGVDHVAPALATWEVHDGTGALEPVIDPADGSGVVVTSWTQPGLRVDLAAVDSLLGAVPN